MDFKVFIEGLMKAARNMDDPHYFQLPIAGREDPIFRERVYCYELYHQIRNVLGDTFPYKLDGEVDKQGHPVIPGKKKPDFIVHVPGQMERNLAVVEVKPITVDDDGLNNDLKKLNWLIDKGKYGWAIMLIYGDSKRKLPKEIQSRIADFSKKHQKRILMAWHEGWGKEIQIFRF